MWEQIKAYIDSGKKLKIRGDQLIFLLGTENFTGTLTFHNQKGDFSIIFDNGSVSHSEPYKKYADVLFASLFTISSASASVATEKITWDEFLFYVISALPKNVVDSLIQPYANDYVTLKPEAGNYSFIASELKLNFNGKSKLSVRSLMIASPYVLYFLLLTQMAGIMKGAVKDDSYTKKNSPQMSLESFIAEKEKAPDIFTLLDMKRRTDIDKSVLKKNYFKIANLLHPDKMVNIEKSLHNRALDVMGRVNMAYDILKTEEDLNFLLELEQKFGYVKEKLQLENFKEYNTADGKAMLAERIMEFHIAYSIYKTIYDNTSSFYILKKMIKVLPKVPEEKLPRREELIAMYGKIFVQKNANDVDDTLYMIIAKSNEKLGNIQSAIDVLKTYLKSASSSNVKKYLERLEFYAKK